ncbi:MAG: signal peptidase I [Candidatus Zixiibacteriota bacterium]|nr:MAG: signal peptidase I [candidate division Zixibacteria bacterium]
MTPQIAKRKRRTWGAAVLAVLGAGLGHLYSGKLGWAVVWLVVYLFSALTFYPIMVNWDARPFNVIVPFAGLFLLYLIQVVHAGWSASRQPQEYAMRPYNRWYYYVLWFFIGIVLLWPIQSSWENYHTFNIPSQGMARCLYADDYLFADLSAYDTEAPQRGDVVIFVFPRDGVTQYIMRCVAVSGDTVEIVDKKLFINGIPASEPATVQFIDTTETGEPKISESSGDGQHGRDNLGPIVVPVRHFFMMGDNRDNSYDSRFWGTVPRHMIRGKAIRVYMSFDWDRIGLTIE